MRKRRRADARPLVKKHRPVDNDPIYMIALRLCERGFDGFSRWNYCQSTPTLAIFRPGCAFAESVHGNAEVARKAMNSRRRIGYPNKNELYWFRLAV